jgi:hypothetical protein
VIKTIRVIAGLVVGVLCAAGIARGAFAILQSLWPEYAAAAPDKAYTLPMLWARLGVAALLTLLSAAAATVVAADRRVAWVLGSLFVVVSLPSHLYHVWADYPAWYHGVYLASLVPIAWIGGRLVPIQSSRLS